MMQTPAQCPDVTAAGRASPDEDAGSDLLELPVGVVLEQMVGAAQAAEVASTGQPAVVEGDGVVQVTAPGGLPAPGETAGQVPGGNVRAPARRGIGGGGQPGLGSRGCSRPQPSSEDPARRPPSCGGRRVG